MPDHGRIAWGHALTGVGLLVRRASLPLAVAVLALVVLTGAAGGHPIAGALWIVALPVLVFVLGRLLAVGIAAVGWIVFPPNHRLLLSEIATRRPHES